MMFKIPFVNSDFLVAGFYVDDSKFITNNETELRRHVAALATHGFTGKLISSPEKFLGLQYEYFENEFGGRSLLLHQETHAIKFITKLGLESSQHKNTPLDVNHENIPADDKLLDAEGKKDYQSCCGDAIWMNRVRYDQLVTVSVLATDMSSPTEHSFTKVKRYARYINSTPRHGLIFHPLRKGEECQTYTYVDSGVKGSFPKSGVALFLGQPDFENHINKNAAVLAFVKKEKTAVMSSMHGEILAIGRGVVATLWAGQIRDEMNLPQTGPAIIFTDNQAAIRFLTNTGRALTRETRHLRARVDFIQQAYREGRIVFHWVPTHLNCADALTKPLGPILFGRHIPNLMGQR